MERGERSSRGTGVFETSESRPGQRVAVEVDAADQLMDLLDKVAVLHDRGPIEVCEDPRHGLALRA